MTDPIPDEDLHLDYEPLIANLARLGLSRCRLNVLTLELAKETLPDIAIW